jgi:hypothetical protein
MMSSVIDITDTADKMMSSGSESEVNMLYYIYPIYLNTGQPCL